MSLPDVTRRLFGHYDPGGIDLETASDFVIGRLLEEGESADLVWLADTAGETAMSEWLVRAGDRQLSTRSRRFWELVLGRTPPDLDLSTEKLWPL